WRQCPPSPPHALACLLPAPVRGGVGGCGGADDAHAPRHTSTPLPSPPPQGGREQTEREEGTASPSGFSESPQAQYTSDAELIESSPELARALGLDGDPASLPEPQFERAQPSG